MNGNIQDSEQGIKTSLDSSVSSYYALHPYGEEVTVRHLLNHTAGIPNPAPINWFHLAEDHENFDENRTLAGVLKNSKLKSAPGEKYRYSNISYWLTVFLVNKIEISESPINKFSDFLDKAFIHPQPLG